MTDKTQAMDRLIKQDADLIDVPAMTDVENEHDARVAERYDVAQWLREQAHGFDLLNLVWMGDYLRRCARQIENGNHLKGLPNDQ